MYGGTVVGHISAQNDNGTHQMTYLHHWNYQTGLHNNEKNLQLFSLRGREKNQ